jgi:hypothetical protein
MPHDGQLTIAIADSVTIKAWLDSAVQDAERRGLAALRPLLESLAQSTSALRIADWNGDASAEPADPKGRDAC